MSDQPAPHEIVIVRRRGGDGEEGHHGGVWKIAYADFMTAMMAFFLVMWLVNAADKKVLTQVASYFNPLKMSDRVTANKGVEDMTEGSQGKGKSHRKSKQSEEKNGTNAAGETDSEEGKSSEKTDEEADETAKQSSEKASDGGQSHLTEQELFSDPYGILEKLAAQAVVGSARDSETGKDAGQDRAGGDSFRDPFDPDFNRTLTAEVEPSARGKPGELGLGNTSLPDEQGEAPEAATGEQGKAAEQKPVESPEKEAASRTDRTAAQKPSGSPVAAGAGDAGEKKAKALQEKIEKAVEAAAPGLRPAISVVSTPEGLMISLTDDFDFGMFEISSARPNPNLVVAVKKIGEILKGIEGAIVVRGHTDRRPFKKGTSDNWKLSSERAIVTRYMLIAGGVPEAKFQRVEGYADSSLKVASDPNAARNRRIEILLRMNEKLP